jgi:Protein of unknown function (DUF2924)
MNHDTHYLSDAARRDEVISLLCKGFLRWRYKQQQARLAVQNTTQLCRDSAVLERTSTGLCDRSVYDHTNRTENSMYTADNVLPQLAALPHKTAPELKKLWSELYRTPPPPFNKPYYIKRLAYRLQELAYNVDSSVIEKRLAALSVREIDKPAQTRKRLEVHRPATGTQLMREWQGNTHYVTVLADGFEYAGQRFGSLSAVARHITGTRWNGLVFFGLKRMQAPTHD